MSAQPVSSDPEPDGTSSTLEGALADLLSGPFDKVSITMPAALRLRVAERAASTTFSAYVAEVLAREERRLALIELLDDLDAQSGSPTAAEAAEADRRWEAMWARHGS